MTTKPDTTVDTATPTTAPAPRSSPRRPNTPLRVVAGVLIAVVAVSLPAMAPGWLGLLVIAGVFFLIVLGLNLLMGYAGQVSLGQTLFMALGGYGAGLLTLKWHWPTLVAMIVMAAGSALVAAAFGSVLLRLRGYYLALATLGLAVITESLASGLVDFTGGPSGLVGVPSLQLGPVAVFTDQANYYVLLVVCALGAWFVGNLQRSQTGRALSAIAADPAAARMLGINASRYKTSAFVVSAVYASLGGSLYAYYLRFFSPEVVGVTVAFSIVIMLALGGARTLLGPLIGALVIQGLPEVGQSFAAWSPFVAGVVLILVITYLPLGIWGSAKKLVRR